MKETLTAYRDDGPLATAVAAIVPGRSISPVALLMVGTVPLAGALALERGAGALVGGALAWFVLVAGASRARDLSHRIDWLMPLVLRATEYGFTIALAAAVDPDALPAAYAVLFAASVHQYEVVYRIRHTGDPPPTWVGWLGGAGFEGRMILVYVFAVADVLAAGCAGLAAFAGLIFILESAWVWVRRPA